MIYIVIPVFNRIAFTVECIRSLQEQSFTDHQVIVVDDGSTDGTKEIINSQFPEVIVLKGNGNLWWTGSTNMGVQKALELSTSENDFILTLNNDLVVKENYLGYMLAVAGKYPASLIGSVSVDIDAPDKVHYAGTKWNAKTASYRPAVNSALSYKELSSKTDIVETDLLPGRGVLVPIRAFREIGIYDQQRFPHYMADEDFALRAKKAGYKLLISTQSVVYNHVNATGLKDRKKSFKYYVDVFTSIKSPANTTYRWNWARQHAAIFPPVYFTIDLMRILKSLLFKF